MRSAWGKTSECSAGLAGHGYRGISEEQKRFWLRIVSGHNRLRRLPVDRRCSSRIEEFSSSAVVVFLRRRQSVAVSGGDVGSVARVTCAEVGRGLEAGSRYYD